MRLSKTSHCAGSLAMAMGILLLPASRIGADGEGRVLLRGGSFLMGTDEADISKLKESYGINFPSAFENELPVHRVTVGDFRMDRTEVTNERFAAFLAENSDWLPDRLPIERHNGNYLQDWRDNRPPRGREDHPVVAITWQAALAFCHWSGGTLPTEAQWEYAARCGDDREFPWGEALPSPDLANFHSSGHGTTVAAGSYPPNDCGLQDLAGSVWEFLYDAWEPTYPSEAQIDPCIDCPMSDGEMLSVEGRRAVRGGSFDGTVVNLRTRWRDSHVVTNAISFVGFRCAYSSEVQSRVGM